MAATNRRYKSYRLASHRREGPYAELEEQPTAGNTREKTHDNPCINLTTASLVELHAIAMTEANLRAQSGLVWMIENATSL